MAAGTNMSLMLEIRAKMDKFISDVEKGVGQATEKSSKKVSGGILSNIKSNVSGIMGEMGLGTLTKLASPAVAATAVITVLKMINDRIQKMLEKLSESSVALKNSRDVMDKMFSLALKPMGDLMSSLMRPYLTIMMQRLRKGLTEIYGTIRKMRAGGKSDEEIIESVMPMFETLAQEMAYMSSVVTSIIKPIAAQIDGFITALDVVYNTFLVGIANWFKGFINGLTNSMSYMPESMVNDILESARKNKSYWENLPQRMRDDIFTYVDSHADKLKELPDFIALEYAKHLLSKIEKAMDDAFNPIKDPLAAAAARFLIAATGIGDGLDAAADWFRQKIASITGTTYGTPLNSKVYNPPALGSIAESPLAESYLASTFYAKAKAQGAQTPAFAQGVPVSINNSNYTFPNATINYKADLLSLVMSTNTMNTLGLRGRTA